VDQAGEQIQKRECPVESIPENNRRLFVDNANCGHGGALD
jgi:hypothetical protein